MNISHFVKLKFLQRKEVSILDSMNEPIDK